MILTDKKTRIYIKYISLCIYIMYIYSIYIIYIYSIYIYIYISYIYTHTHTYVYLYILIYLYTIYIYYQAAVLEAPRDPNRQKKGAAQTPQVHTVGQGAPGAAEGRCS